MTASSYASTATPLKLDLGGSDGLGLGESEFGDIFGNRKSTIMEETPSIPPIPTQYSSQILSSSNSTQQRSDNAIPQPQQYKSHATQNELHLPPRQQSYNEENYPPRELAPRRTGSPYSWKSGASEERLMASPHQQSYADSPAFRSSPVLHSDAEHSFVLDALHASQYLDNEHNPQGPRHVSETTPAPRNRQPGRAPPSAYRGPELRRPSPLQESSTHPSENNVDGFTDVDLTFQAGNTDVTDDEPLFDAPRPRRPIFRGNARSTTAPQQNSKVMTPAEFEEYKKRKENDPPEEDNISESSSDSEVYEDVDEVERQKEAAKQRRRQEAHLAVYRQQMMKVTGEQPSELPSHPPSRMPLERASNSAPALGSMSFENKLSPDPAKSSEDEDEEIPLGVLQAHGFPSKNRPPTRLSQSTSSVHHSESTATYPQPGGSTRNDAAAGGGGNLNLPVFAKHLPQDPYVGASIVNQPTKESLPFNNTASSPAAQQQPQGPPASAGNLPPGGLVGVIATEERAKALRRGSPNTRGMYDAAPFMQLPHEIQQQQVMQQQQMQQHSSNMSASEQSQLNVANQMTQMMQMQMQWMQMMMQNGGQTPPQGMQSPQLPQQNLPTPNFLGPDPLARPMSTVSSVGAHSRGGSNAPRGPSPGRASGMPAASSQSVYGIQGPGAGYTPSIAPSERSTVGQPSRYRPVTPGANQNRDSRRSSVSQQTVQGPTLRGQRSQSRLRNESGQDTPKPSILKTVDKPKQVSQMSQDDDEDDDEGWAEMQRQRQARQSRWKQTKPQSTVPTVPGAQESGLEGLYYEGSEAFL